jgi:hypothetical protein
MVQLSNDVIKQMGKVGEDLEAFVRDVQIKVFEGEQATIWAESEMLIDFLNHFPEGNGYFYDGISISYLGMLNRLFDEGCRANNIRHIIVDDEIRHSDSWIYKDLGLWIITTNYFISLLYATFKVRGWDTREIESYCNERGLEFDVVLENNSGESKKAN